jgi:hypothetical protein
VKRHTLFALCAVALTGFSTLVSFIPIRRMFSKLGGDLQDIGIGLFWHEVLPAFAVGLAFVFAAILLWERRPAAATVILVLAPIAVIAADLLIMALT